MWWPDPRRMTARPHRPASEIAVDQQGLQAVGLVLICLAAIAMWVAAIVAIDFAIRTVWQVSHLGQLMSVVQTMGAMTYHSWWALGPGWRSALAVMVVAALLGLTDLGCYGYGRLIKKAVDSTVLIRGCLLLFFASVGFPMLAWWLVM